MALGWYRVKMGPFDSLPEWERAIREGLAPSVGALEPSHDLIRYYFLNHSEPVQEIMLNFYGDPWRLLEELLRVGWGHKIMPNMPERFDSTDERYRFDDDYMIGIALFEMGSRLALANRQRRPLLETNQGASDTILVALRHAFCNGLLSRDEPFVPSMNPALQQLHAVFTYPHPTAQ